MTLLSTRTQMHALQALPRATPAVALLLALAATTLPAQVAPLAPRWEAGDTTPPVETFADGLARHHIALTESTLIAALHDPDGEVRSLAAAQLGATDDHPALPQIMRALNDERDPQVQVNIAGAASWLGSKHALDQLQLLCQDVNVPPTARLDAARYVSHKQLPTCFSAITDVERTSEDPAVRVLALITAASYHGQAEKAQTLATTALADLDPTVRVQAADSLRSLHATTAIEALNRALQAETDDTAREHIREAVRVLNSLQTEKS